MDVAKQAQRGRRLFITGANGFVGSPLSNSLVDLGHHVLRGVRNASKAGDFPIGDLESRTSWKDLHIDEYDAVIHLAGAVPDLKIKYGNAEQFYLNVNTNSTERFASYCADRGVKRFIFLSSVKVFGDGSDQPYKANDHPFPKDFYAKSKLMAEERLTEIADRSGMELIIIRAPLVYGPGARGNFLKLFRAVDSGIPLPLGCIKNARSIVYVGNLVALIIVCVLREAEVKRLMLVRDGNVSTPQLIRAIGKALNKNARIFPVPVRILRAAGLVLNRRGAMTRVINSLSVDVTDSQEALGWSPHYSMEYGLRETARWYRKRKN
jgi:nucleoside-diphosphate-sugar epimerase